MKKLFFCIVVMLATACQTFKPFTFVQMSDTQIGFIDSSPAFAHSDSLFKTWWTILPIQYRIRSTKPVWPG